MAWARSLNKQNSDSGVGKRGQTSGRKSKGGRDWDSYKKPEGTGSHKQEKGHRRQKTQQGNLNSGKCKPQENLTEI